MKLHVSIWKKLEYPKYINLSKKIISSELYFYRIQPHESSTSISCIPDV